MNTKKFIKFIKKKVKELLDSLSLNENPKDKKEIDQNKNVFLIYLIGLPVSFSLLYFYGIGRDRFFVRSDVVVRKSNKSSSSGFNLTNFLGSGNSGSLEDARFLMTYLESPQVLTKFEKLIDFKSIYKKKGLDFYTGLNINPTFQEKYDFFRRQISLTLNELSGVLRIRTLGLDPKTAYMLNKFLIDEAEIFTNKLNQEVYKNQLEFLDNQVLKNSEKLQKANKELIIFQESFQVLDPTNEALLSGNIIAALERELSKFKVELSSLKRSFVDQKAPEIVLLENQIEELEKQILEERIALVNPNERNLSSKISKLEELKLSKQYAYDLYLSSLTTAEKTRIDSIQKQRFLAIISMPKLPEEQWNYWRHRGFLTSISIIFITISLIKFIFGMADSHNT